MSDGPTEESTEFGIAECLVAERDFPSPQIDEMVDAMRRRERRVVLLTLLNDTTENSIEVLERAIDAGDLPTSLLTKATTRWSYGGNSAKRT